MSDEASEAETLAKALMIMVSGIVVVAGMLWTYSLYSRTLDYKETRHRPVVTTAVEPKK